MDPIVLFRMAERLTLTAVVLIVAFVVMVGFWRTVQRIRLEKGDAIGFGGSVMFSTPVFVLLTIVGYAYVSLSHPISVGVSGMASGEVEDEVVAGTPSGGFLGGTALPPANIENQFADAQRLLRSLNCMKPGSARVEDDVVEIKLKLMGPVWNADWGKADAFADWARGISTDVPNTVAKGIFEEGHVAC